MPIYTDSDRKPTMYVSVVNHQLCYQVAEPTPQSKSRTNKVGRIVHECFMSHFDGMLSHIEVRGEAELKQWCFSFEDPDQRIVLNLPYRSREASRLLLSLPNLHKLDITAVHAFKGTNAKGEPETAIFFRQNEKTVTRYYTKDNPNGLPEAKQIVVNSAKTWDFTQQLAFLEGKANELFPKNPYAKPAETVEDLPY